jgi:hypothetical protein
MKLDGWGARGGGALVVAKMGQGGGRANMRGGTTPGATISSRRWRGRTLLRDGVSWLGTRARYDEGSVTRLGLWWVRPGRLFATGDGTGRLRGAQQGRPDVVACQLLLFVVHFRHRCCFSRWRWHGLAVAVVMLVSMVMTVVAMLVPMKAVVAAAMWQWHLWRCRGAVAVALDSESITEELQTIFGGPYKPGRDVNFVRYLKSGSGRRSAGDMNLSSLPIF